MIRPNHAHRIDLIPCEHGGDMTQSSGADQAALFHLSSLGPVQIVTVAAPRLFDPLLVDRLDIALRDVLTNHQKVVIDLSHVQYISSAMLGRLVMAWMGATTRGARLVLCGVSDTLKEIFRIAGLDQRLRMYSDGATAATALAGTML